MITKKEADIALQNLSESSLPNQDGDIANLIKYIRQLEIKNLYECVVYRGRLNTKGSSKYDGRSCLVLDTGVPGLVNVYFTTGETHGMVVPTDHVDSLFYRSTIHIRTFEENEIPIRQAAPKSITATIERNIALSVEESEFPDHVIVNGVIFKP